MKLNSSISNSSLLTYMGDVATTFAGNGWNMGDIGSQSIILNSDDLEAYFLDEFNPKEFKLKHSYHNLRNRFVLVTVDGIPTRNLMLWRWKIHRYCGIIRITADGSAYKVMWGLNSGRPTKRLEEHLAIHNAAISRDPSHAAVAFVSPTYAQQYTYAFTKDNEEEFSYHLWTGYPDLVRFAPQGVGYITKTADLTDEVWEKCGEKFLSYNALVLQYQGVFIASNGWDGILGLAGALDRASQNALTISWSKHATVSADFFRQFAKPINLKLNEEVLKYGDL